MLRMSSGSSLMSLRSLSVCKVGSGSSRQDLLGSGGGGGSFTSLFSFASNFFWKTSADFSLLLRRGLPSASSISFLFIGSSFMLLCRACLAAWLGSSSRRSGVLNGLRLLQESKKVISHTGSRLYARIHVHIYPPVGRFGDLEFLEALAPVRGAQVQGLVVPLPRLPDLPLGHRRVVVSRGPLVVVRLGPGQALPVPERPASPLPLLPVDGAVGALAARVLELVLHLPVVAVGLVPATGKRGLV